MANHPRARKRVHATIPRRSPNGSAFQKCDICGDMVAIALADMHECGPKKKELKKFKGISGTQNAVKPMVRLQPRSAFNIFWESFMEANKNGNLVDVDRKVFETWKNMSEEVDDEADSAMVGKFDEFYEDYGYYETSDDDGEPYHSGGFKSLNTTEQ